METYHKIQTLFKRHLDGPKKGKMIRGAWTTQELEFLAGNEWEFTEKVDGTNIRVQYEWDWPAGDASVRFGGRTDRAVISKPLMDYLTTTFGQDMTPSPRWDGAFEGSSGSVTLFGEGYGSKIQNGGLYRTDQSFVLFDVKIANFWLTRDNVNDIAKKLGIDSVPVIGYGTLHQAIDIVDSGYTFNNQGAVVRYGSGGLYSKWGEFEAEGIVARPVVPLFNRKGDRIITKIKAVDFR